ncbi:MAG: hypothetical protein E6K06_07940 [Methanobacteriota archaeon]|nr:MAG: hypothetical protein E6K09_04280 [Euryarchaeota archaeon]TLZ70405.1 MAG: hypothetical protein E6K06_07940 [Euryarchaeota archaeon]
MATPAEIQLVYVFSALLGLGAVLLALFPALHHAWTFAASRRFVVVLIAVILILGIGAVLLVGSAISDPIYFLPIALVTVGLRLISPYLLYRRIEDRFDTNRTWRVVRWLVGFGFLGLAAILAYHLVLIASGTEASGVAILSEQLIMALGASFLIVRAGLQVRPREATELWPIWSAAVLFAIAFVVVLPYAVPAFETIYAASGLVGWSIAFVVVAFDL